MLPTSRAFPAYTFLPRYPNTSSAIDQTEFVIPANWNTVADPGPHIRTSCECQRGIDDEECGYSALEDEYDGFDEPGADYDCHICLETARNPCVTRCGHLFCWDDLRVWLDTYAHNPRCPVCRTPCDAKLDVTPVFGKGARTGKRSRSASTGAEGHARRRSFRRSGEIYCVPENERYLPSPPPTPPPSSQPHVLQYYLPVYDTGDHAITSPPLDAMRPYHDQNHFPLLPHDIAIIPLVHPLLAKDIVTHHFSRVLSVMALALVLIVLLR